MNIAEDAWRIVFKIAQVVHYLNEQSVVIKSEQDQKYIELVYAICIVVTRRFKVRRNELLDRGRQ